MALNIAASFPGKSVAPSAAYPFGSAQDVTTPGAGDGTPLVADIYNDLFGMQQSFLSAAGLTANGSPDSVTNPQYLDAMLILTLGALSAPTGADNIGVSAGGSVQESLDALTTGQTGGLVVFTTKALLDAFTPSGSPEEESSYKVTNDPASTNNGFYHWDGVSAFDKDADLVQNVIDEANTSEGVSGFAVAQPLKSKSDLIVGNNLFDKSRTTIDTFPDDNLDGILVAGVGKQSSDFTPVKPSTFYDWQGNLTFASFFDKNFNWIAGGFRNVSTADITTPAGAAFFRYAVDDNAVDAFIISETAIPPNYEAYKENVDASQLGDVNETINVALSTKKENDWYDPNFTLQPAYFTGGGSYLDIDNTMADIGFGQQVRLTRNIDENYLIFIAGITVTVKSLLPAFSQFYLTDTLGYKVGDRIKLGYWFRYPDATSINTRRLYTGPDISFDEIINVNDNEWHFFDEKNDIIVGSADWQEWFIGARDTTGADEELHIRGLTLINLETDEWTGERSSSAIREANAVPRENLNPFARHISDDLVLTGNSNVQLLSTSEQNAESFTKEVETLLTPIEGDGFKFVGPVATRFRLNFATRTLSLTSSDVDNLYNLPPGHVDKWLYISFFLRVDGDIDDSLTSIILSNEVVFNVKSDQFGIPSNEWVKITTHPVQIRSRSDIALLSANMQINATPNSGSATIRIAGLTIRLSESKLLNTVQTENIASESIFHGLKYSSLGDSITAGGGYQRNIAAFHGTKNQDRGIGGSTIKNNGSIAWVDANGNYLDRPPSPPPAGTEGVDYFEIDASACTQERIDTLATDTDLLTIMGGANDWGQDVLLGAITDAASDSSSGSITFFAGYKSMLDKALLRCPDARLVLLNITTINSGDNFGVNGNGNTVEDFRDAIRTLGKFFGYPVIETSDLGVNTGNFTEYLNDATHPNLLYDYLIGSKISGVLSEFVYDQVKDV